MAKTLLEMNTDLMGTFYASCSIENIADRGRSAEIESVLVDTGSEYTWMPKTILEKIGVNREKKDISFVMANRRAGAKSSKSQSRRGWRATKSTSVAT